MEEVRFDVLRRFDRALWIGPVAFFVAACAWSVLDAEFSTDTWMGLATGRQLMEQLDWRRFYETFPLQDSFSYTFYGSAWFNGNWLSNLVQYWIYERMGASAVAYATWAIAACIQVLVLLAVYWRTESWLAACLSAAFVGIGERDFLEPRAAIVGLLCLAALWALICAIEGQRDRRRWWPVVLLLPLLVFWSNAHGGFVFGYGLVALYVGHWAAVRFGKFDTPASTRQILAIATVLIAAVAITAVLSPFGIRSFTHSGQIASSTVFRSVSEWHPAYSRVGTLYPPMWRFWGIVGLTGSGVLLLWLAGKIALRSAQEAPDRGTAPLSLFDAAVVLICVCMTLWARRFAPLLYVLSAPILAVWIMRLAEPLAPHLRGYGVPALKLGAVLAAVLTGWLTWRAVQRDLIDAFKDQPATGILERARGLGALDEAIRFAGENGLRVNMFTHYGDGGSVMFYAPHARVFIDGRSDQLYTEQHFRRYFALVDSRTPADELLRSLDQTATDAVLVPGWAGATALQRTLLFSPDWALAFFNARYMLCLRRGSPGLNRLGELALEGKLWWPPVAETTMPYAQASRAMVLLNTSPSNRAQALDLLERTVDRHPPLGQAIYPAITRALAETDGMVAATNYILLQMMRVTSDAALDSRMRTELLASLAESRIRLEHAEHDRVGPVQGSKQ